MMSIPEAQERVKGEVGRTETGESEDDEVVVARPRAVVEDVAVVSSVVAAVASERKECQPTKDRIFTLKRAND